MLETTKMLQPKNDVIEREYASDQGPSPADLIHSIRWILRRQLPLILLCALAGIVLGAVYIELVAPTYTAVTRLFIDPHRPQVFQQKSVIGDDPVDNNAVESQLQILKSEGLLEQVVKKLGLTTDPEFVAIDKTPGLASRAVRFIRTAIGRPRPQVTPDPTREAITALTNKLKVGRVDLSFILEIAVTSLDRNRAAQLANTLADTYVADQLDHKFQATQKASEWLQERLRELKDQSERAEREIIEFKATNNIVTAGVGGKPLNEDQLNQLNSQLIVARNQTSDAKARLDRITTVISSDSPDTAVNATVTDTLNNPIITKLREQYLDLINREADWSAKYGANHLAAVNLRRQIHDIRSSMLDELKRIAETYKSDYEIAKQRQDSLEKSLVASVSQAQTTNQAQIKLRELDSSAQSSRALYDNFLQRYMQSTQELSLLTSEARVISRASPPVDQTSPKSLLVMALSSVGGLAFGFGLGLLRELLDRVFRTSKQVEEKLRLGCVAIVPEVGPVQIPKISQEITDGGDERRQIRRDGSVMWNVIYSPFSRYAESIRSLKLAADLNAGIRTNKVVGLTSSLPAEGKSSLAGALSLLCSQVGSRAILVDCDLRNPSLSESLSPHAESGLLEVIAGSKSLEEALWTDPATKLDFLPMVFPTRLAHSSEILAAEGTKALFERLRSLYDYVIVDLPPLAPVVDVRSTVNFVDSYFFVVRWGTTKIDVAEHALGDAKVVYDNILGAVLNRASINALSRFDGSRKDYYRNKSYARYGYSE